MVVERAVVVVLVGGGLAMTWTVTVGTQIVLLKTVASTHRGRWLHRSWPAAAHMTQAVVVGTAFRRAKPMGSPQWAQVSKHGSSTRAPGPGLRAPS